MGAASDALPIDGKPGKHEMRPIGMVHWSGLMLAQPPTRHRKPHDAEHRSSEPIMHEKPPHGRAHRTEIDADAWWRSRRSIRKPPEPGPPAQARNRYRLQIPPADPEPDSSAMGPQAGSMEPSTSAEGSRRWMRPETGVPILTQVRKRLQDLTRLHGVRGRRDSVRKREAT